MKYVIVLCLIFTGCAKCKLQPFKTGTDLSIMPIGAKLEQHTDGTKYWSAEACAYDKATKK